MASLTRMSWCAWNKLYMPVATSIVDLYKKTVAALEADHAPKTLEEVYIEVPGFMWVSVQFCAKNPLSSRALHYTGKLDIVNKVQQRTLRAYNIDSHYESVAYTYMRSYAMWSHGLLVDVNNYLSVIST